MKCKTGYCSWSGDGLCGTGAPPVSAAPGSVPANTHSGCDRLKSSGSAEGPVILPVFKTGGGHLRGVCGGFDSHSLPPTILNDSDQLEIQTRSSHTHICEECGGL